MARALTHAAQLLLVGALVGVSAPVSAATSLPAGTPGTFVAIDVEDGRMLAAIAPDQWGSPASVTKLVVATAALELLGPEHRAVTRLTTATPARSGIVDGDVVIVPSADPTWQARFEHGPDGPRALAQQLVDQGIRRITGALVLDRERFGGRAVPPERAWSDSGWGRAAPSSALAVDSNSVDLTIGPGARVGEPASAKGPRWLSLRNEMRTVGADRHGRGTVDAIADSSCDELLLRGDYPISEPGFTVRVAVPNPDRHAAEVVLEAVQAAGITVEGGLRLGNPGVAVGDGRVVLAQHTSPPLIQWLIPMLRDSDNWLADMLLRHLALTATGSGRLDDAARWLPEALAQSFAVDAEAFALADGSGLTPTSLTSGRALAQLLAQSAHRPWFPALLEALPSAGQGTLRGWPNVPAGVRAKTGTLARHVALAGYTTAGGRTVAFAALVGPILDDRDAARRWISAQIAALSRSPSAAAAGRPPSNAPPPGTR